MRTPSFHFGWTLSFKTTRSSALHNPCQTIARSRKLCPRVTPPWIQQKQNADSKHSGGDKHTNSRAELQSGFNIWCPRRSRTKIDPCGDLELSDSQHQSIAMHPDMPPIQKAWMAGETLSEWLTTLIPDLTRSLGRIFEFTLLGCTCISFANLDCNSFGKWHLDSALLAPTAQQICASWVPHVCRTRVKGSQRCASRGS